MSRQHIRGNWHEIKGSVRERWGEITDDEIDLIESSGTAGRRSKTARLREKAERSAERRRRRNRWED